MSFLASLFALNVSSFPRSDGNVLYSPGWIFPILCESIIPIMLARCLMAGVLLVGVTAAISIPLVLLAAYVDSIQNLLSFLRWPWDRKHYSGETSEDKNGKDRPAGNGTTKDDTAGDVTTNNNAEGHNPTSEGPATKKLITSDSDNSMAKSTSDRYQLPQPFISRLWSKLRGRPEELLPK